MPIDEWGTAAETDDVLVADLLLRLKHSGGTWTKKAAIGSALSFGGLKVVRWGRRKARSRPGVTRFVLNRECKERATRSPTTVLSWSGGGGGTSVSGSGNFDGFKASSMTCCRSKDTAANDLANSKRLKRKKTCNELKEEEGSLLQERQNLNRDLISLRATLIDHRTTNKKLKRIKSMSVQCRRMTTLAVEEHPFVSVPKMAKTSATRGLPLVYTPVDWINEITPPTPQQTSFSFYSVPKAKDRESFMLLPDLNMLPSIDEECL